jgi:hypothetical protein
VLAAISERMQEVGRRLHPDKTRIDCGSSMAKMVGAGGNEHPASLSEHKG